MDNLYYTISWILIVLGALVVFFIKPILKRLIGDERIFEKYNYIFKIIGMWLVVIGAIIIFYIGGSYGAGNK